MDQTSNINSIPRSDLEDQEEEKKSAHTVNMLLYLVKEYLKS